MNNAILAILMDAGNDTNGNPRRCWVVMTDDGAIADVIDEGYSGSHVVVSKYPNVVIGPRFSTTPAEYRNLLRRK